VCNAGEIHSRERQLERAQEDIAKLKEQSEELTRQLSESNKTKDEGWSKLNEQLSEIEHLREVINEQERMLEERGPSAADRAVAAAWDCCRPLLGAEATLDYRRDMIGVLVRRGVRAVSATD